MEPNFIKGVNTFGLALVDLCSPCCAETDSTIPPMEDFRLLKACRIMLIYQRSYKSQFYLSYIYIVLLFVAVYLNTQSIAVDGW